jgi:hypothetical protein
MCEVRPLSALSLSGWALRALRRTPLAHAVPRQPPPPRRVRRWSGEAATRPLALLLTATSVWITSHMSRVHIILSNPDPLPLGMCAAGSKWTQSASRHGTTASSAASLSLCVRRDTPASPGGSRRDPRDCAPHQSACTCLQLRIYWPHSGTCVSAPTAARARGRKAVRPLWYPHRRSRRTTGTARWCWASVLGLGTVVSDQRGSGHREGTQQVAAHLDKRVDVIRDQEVVGGVADGEPQCLVAVARWQCR